MRRRVHGCGRCSCIYLRKISWRTRMSMIDTICADSITASSTSQWGVTAAIFHAHSEFSSGHLWSTLPSTCGDQRTLHRVDLWYLKHVLCFCYLSLLFSIFQAPCEEFTLIDPYLRTSPEWPHVVSLCHRDPFMTDHSTITDGNSCRRITSDSRRS